MDRMQALNTFWNSFDIPAYDENTVPDDAKLPYITYSAGEDDFNHLILLTASIWYRSKTWVEITNKLNQISEKISMGGINIPYDHGTIFLRKGSPFAQRMGDEDDSIRRIYINVGVEFIN